MPTPDLVNHRPTPAIELHGGRNADVMTLIEPLREVVRAVLQKGERLFWSPITKRHYVQCAEGADAEYYELLERIDKPLSRDPKLANQYTMRIEYHSPNRQQAPDVLGISEVTHSPHADTQPLA